MPLGEEGNIHVVKKAKGQIGMTNISMGRRATKPREGPRENMQNRGNRR
jgi:hypothetical protein